MATSPTVEDTRQQLELAVNDLKNAAQIPAKQRQVKINGIVDKVCSKAYEIGLSPVLLDSLVTIIAGPNHLDQSTAVAIVRSLYPSHRIADDTLLRVVCGLGHGQGKMPLAVQATFIKWLIMVYESLAVPKRLSHLYSVIFNLIHTSATRAPACHLLSLITRRKHVRPFRIQILIELSRQVGNEPAIVGLLRVYKDYYPDVIVGNVSSGRASVFTHPDPEWRDRLREIQEAGFYDEQRKVHAGEKAFRVARQGINGVRRNQPIPQVHTSRAEESSVTLEEIENVTHFIDHLEKIELPNQLIAVIGDPLLQKLMQLKAGEDTMQRVENWLLAFFEDQLAEPASEATVLDMLRSIQAYARYTKTLPVACLKYLNSMLGTWDGTTGRGVILDLLSFLPLQPFEEIYDKFLRPTEDAILDSTLESQVAIIELYTSLLRQWTATLLSLSEVTPEANATITSLVSHVNVLALSILQNSPTILSGRPDDSVLAFYERFAYLLSSPSLIAYVRITILPESLVYTLQFSTSLASLSRICAVLAHYKRAFGAALAPNGSPTQAKLHTYPKGYIERFNGFLMDICNCLWRSKAFNNTDANALGCLLPEVLVAPLTTYVGNLDTNLALRSLFTLSYTPSLCLLAISFFREQEDANEDKIAIRHAGPVSQSSLTQLANTGGLQMSWPAYRLGLLQWLEEKEVRGVSELMYNTLKHLMSAREAVGKS